MIRALLIALVTIAAGLLLWAGRVSTSPVEASILTELNQTRVFAGARPVAADARLHRAALWQARYVADTEEVAHVRQEGGLLATPIERRRWAGYFAPGNEVLALSRKSAARDILELVLAAPYHRMGLLDPAAEDVGVGVVQGGAATEAYGVALQLGGASVASGPVVWPAPGRTVTAYFYPAQETPNPYPAAEIVGYIVSVQAGKPLTTARLSLIDAGTRQEVSGVVRTRNEDPRLRKDAVMFIPLAPLAWGTQYEARFEGVTTDGALEKVWRFFVEQAPAYSLRRREGELKAGQPIAFDFTSPVQPAHVCWRTSENLRLRLRWRAPEYLEFDTQCSREPCAARVYLSADATCSEPKVWVSLLLSP